MNDGRAGEIRLSGSKTVGTGTETKKQAQTHLSWHRAVLLRRALYNKTGRLWPTAHTQHTQHTHTVQRTGRIREKRGGELEENRPHHAGIKCVYAKGYYSNTHTHQTLTSSYVKNCVALCCAAVIRVISLSNPLYILYSCVLFRLVPLCWSWFHGNVLNRFFFEFLKWI